ncbi:MAG: hypothetical protein ACI37T_08425, partial [Candidatus Gastranaerophilaceae bacterium]
TADLNINNIYQDILKVKNIHILTTNYARYSEIIQIRNKQTDQLYIKYKKIKTKESFDKALSAYKKLVKAQERQDIILGKCIDSVINAVQNNSKSTLFLGKVGKNLKTEAITLKNDLEKLVKNIPEIKLNLKETKQGRSYQQNGTINLFDYKRRNLPNKGRLTALHEAMHWLEETDKHIGQKSIEFLEKRTVNDKEEKLSVLTGNTGYKVYEVAKKDNFFSPYCGKIYKINNKYYGTEILSMGIEELLSNPIKFYKNDKEYFKFVINVLKGDI